MMQQDSRIYVAGHRGLVGSAITRALHAANYSRLLLRSHQELDLTHASAVDKFFAEEQPEFVFVAAAKVGGIMANNRYRADFMIENLAIQQNLLTASLRHGVSKLVFLGSSCIYPGQQTSPLREEDLLTGPLEYTNEPYALAKIVGLRMCESINLQYGTNFLALMPCNLFGPGDNFDLVNSHLLPAFIRKMHLAKLLAAKDLEGLRADIALRPIEGLDGSSATLDDIKTQLAGYGITATQLTLWGSGKPRREMMNSDDLAAAALFVMENINFSDTLPARNSTPIRNCHLNVGTGIDYPISEIAEMVRAVVDYKGNITFDTSKPDGTYRKLMDSSKLHQMGWHSRPSLPTGIASLYSWYLTSIQQKITTALPIL